MVMPREREQNRPMITSEPVTEPTVVTLASTPTAVVKHAGVSIADLPSLFDAGFMAIATSGAQIVGPAFALYRGNPASSLDIEIGFPVVAPLASPVSGPQLVEPSTLPGGRALTLSHFGSYDSLHEGWERLMAEPTTRESAPSCYFEVYVTEPTPDADPATLRTDLYWVL